MSARGDGDRIAAAATTVLDHVFATVAEVRAMALRQLCRAGSADAASSIAEPAAELQESVRALLRAPGQLATGLGVIAAPQSGPDVPARVQWWQADVDSDSVLALDPDLRPTSIGFYDYAAAPWFVLPQRTGKQHVVGPYVDVHGTGQYLLTLTQPVAADGRFLGVVGADVPVRRFEARMLSLLGGVNVGVLLVNEEGRVVVSTSPRWLVGDLPPVTREIGPGTPVPGLPWRFHLIGP